MKHTMFAIRDSKADYYYKPFFLKNNGEALRAFSDIICDPNTIMQQHPEDFDIYEIGEYDDHSCVLEPHSPVHLASAVEYQVPAKSIYADLSDPKPQITEIK